MKKLFLLALLAPMLAFAATSPNDNGTPVTGQPALSAYSFTGTVGPGTQLGRLFRDALSSSCPSKTYPGIFDASSSFNVSTHVLFNNGPTQCVTVNFNPDVGANPCTTNAHMSAYLGSYDPANQAANFLGDVGSSIAQPFSFTAPAGARIVLVVTNTSAAAACTYAFNTAQLDAGVAIAEPIVVPTLDWTLLLASAFLLGGIALYVRRRQR